MGHAICKVYNVHKLKFAPFHKLSYGFGFKSLAQLELEIWRFKVLDPPVGAEKWGKIARPVAPPLIEISGSFDTYVCNIVMFS